MGRATGPRRRRRQCELGDWRERGRHVCASLGRREDGDAVVVARVHVQHADAVHARGAREPDASQGGAARLRQEVAYASFWRALVVRPCVADCR